MAESSYLGNYLPYVTQGLQIGLHDGLVYSLFMVFH